MLYSGVCLPGALGRQLSQFRRARLESSEGRPRKTQDQLWSKDHARTSQAFGIRPGMGQQSDQYHCYLRFADPGTFLCSDDANDQS